MAAAHDFSIVALQFAIGHVAIVATVGIEIAEVLNGIQVAWRVSIPRQGKVPAMGTALVSLGNGYNQAYNRHQSPASNVNNP